MLVIGLGCALNGFWPLVDEGAGVPGREGDRLGQSTVSCLLKLLGETDRRKGLSPASSKERLATGEVDWTVATGRLGNGLSETS